MSGEAVPGQCRNLICSHHFDAILATNDAHQVGDSGAGHGRRPAVTAQPETLFAAGPEGQVAYQVWGGGTFDLLFVPPWIWNIDMMWDHPGMGRYLRRLGTFSRVIAFDKRGTGVSDPVPLGALPTLEQWVDDIRVVLDAAESSRVAILGNLEGV